MKTASSRTTLAFVLGTSLLVPCGAKSEERLPERTLRALRHGSVGTQNAGGVRGARGIRGTERPQALQDVLAEWRQKDALRRGAFEAVAARRLPLKALERLRAAREAYQRGHGRLLNLLGALSTGKASPGTLEEAEAVLSGLRDTSRVEILSATDLKVGAPIVQAPTLSVGDAATTPKAAPDAFPLGQIPAEIQSTALSLGTPVAVYEWVQRTFKPEFYYGQMKGPLETYLEASGNDADTASVLVLLLRALGIPARYVRGNVTLSGQAVMALTGTTSPGMALQVLNQAGIPNQPVAGAGGVSRVTLERVWVEAYVPYVNYRGAVLDSAGKFWIPLDPGYKALEAPHGIDVVGELGFDTQGTLDAYLKADPSTLPLDFARSQAAALLAEQRPGLSYSDLLNSRSALAQVLGILPNSLPYAVQSVIDVGYDLPETLGHTVRVVGRAGGATVLDVTIPTAQVVGRRVSISYIPATDDDVTVVDAFGGLSRTPPYLIDVMPVLKIGGVSYAEGLGPVGMGVKYTLEIQLGTPSLAAPHVITNSVVAGNLLAINFGGSTITGTEAGSDKAAQILSARAWSYLSRWSRSDEELADLFHVVLVRPTVSECMVMSEIDVDYAGGDPLYPMDFTWKGIAIDADLHSVAPVGIEAPTNQRPFLLLSGLQGSVLENRVFEDDLGIPSVSTAKAIQLAGAQGIPILDLDATSAAGALQDLPLDPSVIAEIEDATGRGLVARVPAAPVTYLAWTGVGYILLDPNTGQAAYQLQGGHSGGVTAPAVLAIPQNLTDALVEQQENAAPAPEGASVAIMAKFPSTDYQEGTVGTPLASPFKVLVTDGNGHPVANAPVKFTVIGGGGILQDPVTKRPAGGQVVVFSNSHGEASAALVLGTQTALIPRFVQSAGDKYATQVGLNLVTASAGSVQLPEPFSAFGFPDVRRGGTEDTATLGIVNSGQDVSAGLTDPNLSAVGPLLLSVSDQYGNPVSNFSVTISYVAPPVLGIPPVGSILLRGATATPGAILSAADFAACLQQTAAVSILYGQCAAQAPSITVLSTSQGISAYPVLGDSPYSRYTYSIGTASTPNMLTVQYRTLGWFCFAPTATACSDGDTPIVTTRVNTRPVLVDKLGNVVEAYQPGKQTQVLFSAESITEGYTLSKTVDKNGKPHYWAHGNNQWATKPLTDATIKLEEATPGTIVEPVAASRGDGTYVAQMTLGPTPQLNTIQVDSDTYPLVIPYLPTLPLEVNPAYVDDVRMTVALVRSPQPFRSTGGAFSVWGARPSILFVKPAPVLLDQEKVVAKQSVVMPGIEPVSYELILDPTRVRFDVLQDGQARLTGDSTSFGVFTIPTGLSLPGDNYSSTLTLRGVSLADVTTFATADLTSAPVPLTVCKLVDLKTPLVIVHKTRDPLNGITCGDNAPIVFNLCSDSRVTVTVRGQEPTALVDGNLVPVTNLLLTAGTHSVVLTDDVLANLPGGTGALTDALSFNVHAVQASDSSQIQDAAGKLQTSIVNRAVLPVGRTFVKGVDLFDGHMVRQSTDVKLAGRHLGLEITRSYSSAGDSPEGVLGAGWAFNYASSLSANAKCPIVTVTTPDGSSQTFRTSDGGATFVPQKGYHTKLVRNADGSHDFFDKGHNRYHFRRNGDPRLPLTMQQLQYIEEPHLDRIVLTYDAANRVRHVAEVQAEAGEVRALDISYAVVAGFDRISKVTAGTDLALEVSYQYDSKGNLKSATRTGQNLAGGASAAPRSESYEYMVGNLKNPHRMIAAVDPNGHRVEYHYYALTDSFPGSGSGFLVEGQDAFVKYVSEFAQAGSAQNTSFQYDFTKALSSLVFRTTVRDARGNDTVYTLNGNGSPLQIDEPLGKTTRMTWASTDIFKTQETDALGRVTDYGYDARGNLISEIVHAGALGDVVTAYSYEATYNKLTSKTDAEGRQTLYSIDPAAGDLVETTDAVGNVTHYAYDTHGLLESATSPRGHVTAYSDFDSFGHARTTTDPLGNVTTRVYDLRGRLASETDTLGHRTETAFDGLDRPIVVTRFAGGDSSDEVTRTEYFPGGEVSAVTNANGARTTNSLDGMNRVTGTTTTVGAGVLKTSTEYDGNGNKTAETDRRGVTTSFVYDALNRLSQVSIASGLSGEGPTGQIAAYTYDLVGNKKSETNVARLTTRFVVDGLYRVTQRVLPEGPPYTEAFSYDRVGNKLSATDANGQTTGYTYDGLNRLLSTTNPLDEKVTVAYDDPEGSHVNKSEEHDLTRGLRTTYVYDALNRETSRKVVLEGAGSAGETYTTATHYDDASHSHTVTDPRGSPTLTRLDGLDHVVQQIVDVGGLGLTSTMKYDGLGDRTSTTDANGHTTLYAHDELGRLTETTDARQQSAQYGYDGEGLKTSEVDRRGVAKTFTYDNLRRPRVSSITASISGVPWSHETRYDDVGRTRMRIDALRQPTVETLDGLDRVVKTVDALGQSVLRTYDGVNKRSETDRRGNTTSFAYDGLNRLLLVTDPHPFERQTYQTAYDDAANRKVETDRRGLQKTTQLDPLGRVLSVTRSGVALETNRYDGNGNRVLLTDAEQKATQFVYDAANRLIQRTPGYGGPDASSVGFSYDGVGNVIRETSPRIAAAVVKTYDELNRLTTVVDGANETTGYGYDNEGNRTLVQEPAGQTTTFSYDELGHLLSVVQPGDLTTSYSYDRNRNRISQQDANGHVVSMGYDALDRLVTLTQPYGLVTTHRYDANGNETTLTEPKGQSTTTSYDELNRASSRLFAFAPGDTVRPWRYTTGVTYAYDANGNLLEAADSVAGGAEAATLTTRRTYDGLDRLSSEASPLPDGGVAIVAYDYYSNGTRKTLTDLAGAVTRYEYDGQNRLSSVTTQSGTAAAATTSYSYYPDGLLEQVSYPNGVVSRHEYDDANRVTSIRNAIGSAVVSAYAYGYDQNGNRLRQTETNGGPAEDTTYTYDPLNRLASIGYPAESQYPQGRLVTYGYDNVGNRTSEVTTNPATHDVLESKTGTFDDVNRLTVLADDRDPKKTVSFGYDPNGNQTSKTVGTDADAVTTEYVYELRDKLAEVHQGSSTQVEYQWDAEGRLLKKVGDATSGGSGVRQYVYDRTSRLAEYELGTLKAKYDYGSDRLISMWQAGEGTRFYHLDGLRSVTALTDTAGVVTANLRLDTWGNFRFPATDLTATANRFAFTGHVFEQETGLYYGKARFLDPQLGRFISQDSFLGKIDEPPSLHRYMYALASPTRFVDPTGYSPAIAEVMEIRDKLERLAEKMDRAEKWVDKNIKQTLRELGPNLLSVAKEKVIAATHQFARAQVFEQGTPQQIVEESRKLQTDSAAAAEDFKRYQGFTLLHPIEATRRAGDAAGDPAVGPKGVQRAILGATATTGEIAVAVEGAVTMGRAVSAPRPAVVLERGAAGPPELPPADPAMVEAMLARLPARGPGDKTSGTIVMNVGGQIDLKSGVQGPAELMPEGFGYIRQPGTATHVEGHGAAAMRLSEATQANLFINNIPCPGNLGCAAQLPNMLPPNALMRVYGPNGYFQPFVGAADPRPFPMRVGAWVPNPAGSFLLDNSNPETVH